MPFHLAMTLMNITVINGSVPANFPNSSKTNIVGFEWFRAFDGNITTYWVSGRPIVVNYLLVTFDTEYLLSSLQLSIRGIGTVDPQTIYVYLDANATCLGQSFWFPQIINSTFTFAPSQFNTISRPVVAKQLLLGFTRWNMAVSLALSELRFFGFLY
jgi:hypothetical protein